MQIELGVEVNVKSPIHLSSGRADVVIDAEVTHDEFGMPYFSARRFKGLLYESALEVVEMAEICGSNFTSRQVLEELFHRECSTDMQMVLDDLHIVEVDEYENLCMEWRYLQNKYPNIINPKEVLEEYTSIRYQTSIDNNGLAEKGTLHNMRVVNDGITFYGRISLYNVNESAIQLIVIALKNLRSAGLKRNRGFGRIECKAILPNNNISDKMLRDMILGK